MVPPLGNSQVSANIVVSCLGRHFKVFAVRVKVKIGIPYISEKFIFGGEVFRREVSVLSGGAELFLRRQKSGLLCV
jgi:hypothetical protein